MSLRKLEISRYQVRTLIVALEIYLGRIKLTNREKADTWRLIKKLRGVYNE